MRHNGKRAFAHACPPVLGHRRRVGKIARGLLPCCDVTAGDLPTLRSARGLRHIEAVASYCRTRPAGGIVTPIPPTKPSHHRATTKAKGREGPGCGSAALSFGGRRRRAFASS